MTTAESVAAQALKPSRYNVRVQDEAGRWVLYNSMTGAIGGIPQEKEAAILPLLNKGWQGAPDADAKALLEKGFLVPETADELRRAERLKQRRIASRDLHLILMPTEECNFRCRYCYESFKHGRMTRPVIEGVKSLVAAAAGGIDRLDVCWFGGEPTEELDVIEELSHSMLGSTRAHKVPYAATMVTNGSNMDPRNFRRLLASGVRNIQVTIDGLPNEHDSLRVKKDGGPTFSLIWGNIKEALKRTEDFRLAIRVNFNRESLAEMDRFIAKAAAEFKLDPRLSIFFRPVGHWGGPNDSTVAVCTPTAGQSAIFESSRKAQRAGFQSGATYPYLKPNGSVCYAANPRSFVVGPDGTLYKCTVALDKDFNKVGRLLPDGTMDLDEDRFALWTTSDDTNDSVCQACVFRPACQGAACPLVRIETGERPCPTVKKRLRGALLSVWEHHKRFGRPGPVGAAPWNV